MATAGRLGGRGVADLKDIVQLIEDDLAKVEQRFEEQVKSDVRMEVNRQPTPDVGTYRRVTSALQPGDLALLIVYRPRPVSTFLAKVEVEDRK